MSDFNLTQRELSHWCAKCFGAEHSKKGPEIAFGIFLKEEIGAPR